jgi:hypothetical protein
MIEFQDCNAATVEILNYYWVPPVWGLLCTVHN